MMFLHKTAAALLLFSVIFLLEAGGSLATAQDQAKYGLRHYTDEDGLPQNSVRSICRDAEGFIWMATENGLTRFDGSNFFVYNTENTNISSNRFIMIGDGKEEKGLYAYNLNYEHVRISGGTAWRDTSGSIYREDPRRFLEARKLDRLKNEVGEESILKPVTPRSFYLVTKGQLSFYRGNRLVYTVPALQYGKSAWRLFLIDGVLHYCAPDDRLAVFDERGRLQQLRWSGDILGGRGGAGPVPVDGTFENANGPVLFRVGHSLYAAGRRSDGVLDTRLLISDFDFAKNDIASACYDTATGNVFLGSRSNGLYVFGRKQFQTLTVSDEEWVNSFYAQTAVDSHSVAVPQGYLLRPGQPLRFWAGRYFPAYNPYTILADREGYIWRTFQSEISRYAPGGRLSGSWQIPGAVIIFYEGPDGKMWIATRDGQLHYLGPGREKLLRYPVKVPGVSYLLQDSGQYLWAGAWNGLYRVRVADGHIDTVHGLKGQYVRSLYSDRPGRLWVTTYESGLYLYREEGLVHFPLDNDRFMSAAHCIVEDRKGYFWITTNKGLFQASKEDLLAYADHRREDVFYLYYSKNSGFNTNEFNGGGQPGGLLLADGHIILPTLKGLVWFNSDDFRTEFPDKKIFVDRAELNGRRVGTTGPFVLRQYADRLSLWVSVPYFGDQRNIILYYSLSGESRTPAFVRVPSSGVITLQNLSPGRYTLRIRKTNGFGKDNYTEKTVLVEVPHYWYQTPWFYAGMGIVVALLVYLFIRARTGFLRNRNRVLEIVIRKRTLKLEQALRSLEASRETLAKQTFVQERLIAAISHDIRTPLKYLSYFNRKIYELLSQQTTDATLLEMSKSAAESSGRMQHYLSNLLQYMKTSTEKGTVRSDFFSLHMLVQEHIEMLVDMAVGNKTTVVNQVPGDLQLYTNRQILAVILHNIIDNAVKITVEGRIEVSALQTEGTVDIVVSDNGGGISAELQEWVNGTDAQKPAPNSGMGLFIIRELSGMIGARLHIVSDNRSYTEVHVVLPRQLPGG